MIQFFIHMLWKKSGILGKILESLVGIGAGVKFRPVRVSLLGYSRRNVVDFFANELQPVFAVRNTGLPFTTDVTLHLWKRKRRWTSRSGSNMDTRRSRQSVYLERLAAWFVFSGSVLGTTWVLLMVRWTSSALSLTLSPGCSSVCTWGCIFRRQESEMAEHKRVKTSMTESLPGVFPPKPPMKASVGICDTKRYRLELRGSFRYRRTPSICPSWCRVVDIFENISVTK